MRDMDDWNKAKKGNSTRVPVMTRIPAGSFLMGTSNDDIQRLQLKESDWAYDWNDLFITEQPQHKISLPEFGIAQFPVTNAEYYEFALATGHRLPKHWVGFTFPAETAMHPVVGVSKVDVEAYVAWLNSQTKGNYRLPTEAEWEYAARGTDGRIFPWGNTFDPWRCNTSESGKKTTTPVGSYSPGGDSPFGLADMVGNVWEWTSSIFAPYPYQKDDGREEVRHDAKYVLRGGAWYYTRKLARCAAREGNIETYQSQSIGFRMARS